MWFSLFPIFQFPIFYQNSLYHPKGGAFVRVVTRCSNDERQYSRQLENYQLKPKNNYNFAYLLNL